MRVPRWFLTLLLGVGLALSLAACGKKGALHEPGEDHPPPRAYPAQ